jgi:uncharacterized membrane protein YeaQ/YmgE (transglycosylase-associated protein family)
MAYDITTIILFTVLGTFGGSTSALMSAKSYEDLKKFDTLKSIILGAIIGFIYTFLYSDHAFPDSIMSFVSGYMGESFITGLADKLKKKNGNGTQQV